MSEITKFIFLERFGVLKAQVEPEIGRKFKVIKFLPVDKSGQTRDLLRNAKKSMKYLSKDEAFNSPDEAIINKFKKISKTYKAKQKTLKDKLLKNENIFNDFKSKYNIDYIIDKHPEFLL